MLTLNQAAKQEEIPTVRKECRVCGGQASDSARYCPHCGVEYPGGAVPPQGALGKLLTALLTPVVGLIFVIVVGVAVAVLFGALGLAVIIVTEIAKLIGPLVVGGWVIWMAFAPGPESGDGPVKDFFWRSVLVAMGIGAIIIGYAIILS